MGEWRWKGIQLESAVFDRVVSCLPCLLAAGAKIDNSSSPEPLEPPSVHSSASCSDEDCDLFDRLPASVA